MVKENGHIPFESGLLAGFLFAGLLAGEEVLYNRSASDNTSNVRRSTTLDVRSCPTIPNDVAYGIVNSNSPVLTFSPGKDIKTIALVLPPALSSDNVQLAYTTDDGALHTKTIKTGNAATIVLISNPHEKEAYHLTTQVPEEIGFLTSTDQLTAQQAVQALEASTNNCDKNTKLTVVELNN